MADGQVAAILRALAELAPGDRTEDDVADVTAGDHPFLWLGLDTNPWTLFAPELLHVPQHTSSSLMSALVRYDDPVPAAPVVPRSSSARKLQGVDALHHEQQLLRLGWLFLCGRAELDGRPRRVCMPLAVRAVRMRSLPLQGYALDGIGEPAVLGGWQGEPPRFDREVWGGDPSPELLRRFPRMRSWIDEVVRAAGFPPIADVLGPQVRPEEARRRADLVVVIGSGIFVDRQTAPTTRASSLRAWASIEGIDDTALAAVYGVGGDATPSPGDEVELRPMPLTAAQEEVVVRARTEPVTVVSGAPGNGKSHAVCAVAIDAVARGASVLVATPTPFAADVLGELLARQPGPEPVLFGETEGRRRMISVLESMGEHTVGEAELDRCREAARAAAVATEAAEEVVASALEREVRAAAVARWAPRLDELRAAAPTVFAPGADLRGLRRRLDEIGRWPRWWRARQLRSLVGSARIVGIDAIADAVEAAGDIRAELELDTMGGTTIGKAWDELLTAESAEASAEGRLARALALAASRWSGRGRRSVAALLRALPAGRATRRDLLAAIDPEPLVRALPLWVGTLRDVEDLLPSHPGLFDLLIVDEAAQVDQFRAAGALLRARRAVIVGDPRQLRPVSFVADDSIAEALATHGTAALADRLDVRRQALYDVAAGAAPVTFLDEHHRSVPHLIQFSSRRFYDDRVRVATTHPGNEALDAIGLVRVPSVPDEVSESVARVAGMVAAGQRSIGVFTPFRAHADAIEAALLERFEPEELLGHGVRAGTAHSAQGSERDHVIVALGLAPDDPAGRWRFAEDPNLFNVLVTRARRDLLLVTALPEDHRRPGIVADYLRHAEVPPHSQPGGPPHSAWVGALAAELARNGVPCRTSYPVGRWEVDVVAGEGAAAVALDCEVHPDGPEAHLDRHRALRLAGWRTLDAFASRWDGDAARAAVELSGALRGQG